MSKNKRSCLIRLVCRCLVFAGCVLIFSFRPNELDVLQGGNFFRRFSVLHLLWGVWVADMAVQLVPVKANAPLGSQKLFRRRFRPSGGSVDYRALRRYIASATKAAFRVMCLWIAFLAALAVLRCAGVLCDYLLFLLTVALYVCDMVFVLIWCPLRMLMKNRCCTTCRIYNWDHLMIFSPLLFLKGFFSASLLILALAVWSTWEVSIMLWPERFWEQSNEALHCSECTDRLCSRR